MFQSAPGLSAMAGSSRYTRAISSEVGEIERRLRILEKGLEKLGARASANARGTLTVWAKPLRGLCRAARMQALSAINLLPSAKMLPATEAQR
jgi:hypothetical protein